MTTLPKSFLEMIAQFPLADDRRFGELAKTNEAGSVAARAALLAETAKDATHWSVIAIQEYAVSIGADPKEALLKMAEAGIDYFYMKAFPEALAMLDESNKPLKM